MRSNFLEQLIAEWYEYKGYFVRRNLLVGKRLNGGYECELDVVAFNSETQHLVHIEPSMDANSWDVREERYSKKFKAGKEHIPTLFKGIDLPKDIEQIAVFAFASDLNHKTIGGGKVLPVKKLLELIFEDLKNKKLAKEAIAEHLTILRSFQFVAEFRNSIFDTLNGVDRRQPKYVIQNKQHSKE